MTYLSFSFVCIVPCCYTTDEQVLHSEQENCTLKHIFRQIDQSDGSQTFGVLLDSLHLSALCFWEFGGSWKRLVLQEVLLLAHGL